MSKIRILDGDKDFVPLTYLEYTTRVTKFNSWGNGERICSFQIERGRQSVYFFTGPLDAKGRPPAFLIKLKLGSTPRA